MVTITTQFEPVKIVGMDAGASGPSGEGALKNIVLKLSPNPGSGWCTTFSNLWSQHFYMMKRRAVPSGSTLTVTCMENELEDGLLEELKKVVADTNATYKSLVDNTNAQKAKQDAENAASKESLAELAKKLDFD